MRTIALLLLTGLLGGNLFAADPPKPAKKEKPPTPQQIAAAELKLRAASCSVQRSTHERKPWELPPAPKVGEPPPPADLLGFPNDTSDLDLLRLLPVAKILPDIRTVVLWQSQKVTAAGLKAIAADLPYISGLVLTDVSLGANDLRELAALPSLQWVSVSGCRIGDAGLKELAACPRLKSLTLGDDLGISAAGVEQLAAAAQLRELTIAVAADPEPLVEAVSKLTNVAALHVFPVDDAGAKLLAKMQGLISLDLTPTEFDSAAGRTAAQRAARRAGKPAAKPAGKPAEPIKGELTDAGLKAVSAITTLTKLRATGSGITGQNVAELAKLEGLAELGLPHTLFGDEGVPALAKLKALRVLDLTGTPITDDAARDLGDLPRLEILNLSATAVQDRGLTQLARARSLISLVLDGTRVAMTESVDLSSLTALRHLSLQGTNVTANSFKALKTARVATLIDLTDNCPNVTTKTVLPLQAEMPGTRIWADTLCYLGGMSAWPGATYYAFKVPESKVMERPMKESPPQKMPANPPKAAPPPKVAPPVPTRGGGSGVK